ncbi:hypothetical protein J6590_068497 [Homalodisca vitripennis]|nr:hypothetical protein J6590_068497 [Homalodisca vitripennis]
MLDGDVKKRGAGVRLTRPDGLLVSSCLNKKRVEEVWEEVGSVSQLPNLATTHLQKPVRQYLGFHKMVCVTCDPFHMVILTWVIILTFSPKPEHFHPFFCCRIRGEGLNIDSTQALLIFGEIRLSVHKNLSTALYSILNNVIKHYFLQCQRHTDNTKEIQTSGKKCTGMGTPTGPVPASQKQGKDDR